MDYGDTYVPIFRSILSHRYMRDPQKFHFWMWCLLKAAHRPYKQLVGNQTVPVEIGQFIFGRQAASMETGLSEQTVRTMLKFFSSVAEQKLTIKSTNKYSIITVNKYLTYIEYAKGNNHQNNQHLTSNQPASNHKQEGKEGKEGKEVKSIISGKPKTKKISCSFPTDFQYSTRNEELALEAHVVISDELQNFKDHHGAKGNKFVDWNAAFNTWLRNTKKFQRSGYANQDDLNKRRKEVLERGLD